MFSGMNPQEVVHMMLVTQYLDVLKNFAEVIYFNPSPPLRMP
jgi:hypothetical protein